MNMRVDCAPQMSPLDLPLMSEFREIYSNNGDWGGRTMYLKYAR